MITKEDFRTIKPEHPTFVNQEVPPPPPPPQDEEKPGNGCTHFLNIIKKQFVQLLKKILRI